MIVGFIKKRAKIILSVFAVLIIYIFYDLYIPFQNDTRHFNPRELARLDAEMWRSYYQKESFKLFRQLAELLRTEYKMPYIRSYVLAYQAAKAAFVFKKGKNRQDYNLALPYLIRFFSAINQTGKQKFDVKKVAELELEWWIVHRQREQYTLKDLSIALAETSAVIYHISPDKLQKYSDLRAEAMHLRDSKADKITEQDWQKIENLLQQSWISLHKAIN